MTLDETIYDVGLEYLERWKEYRIEVWRWLSKPEEVTLTIIKNITNVTGTAWTSYIEEVGSGLTYCLPVEGSAESEKLPQIAYKMHLPLPLSIEFSGPEPVSNGESFSVRFDVWFDGTVDSPAKFYFELTPNPIPEPATIVMLGLGGLAILRRRAAL